MVFGEYPIDSLALTKALVEQVPGIAGDWNSNRKWTRAVKLVLKQLAEQKGLKFFGSLSEPEICHEWLLDAVWWKEHHGAVLGVESEWGPASDVVEDFERLLAFKAPLKLMIYCANHEANESERAKIRAALQQQLYSFGQHIRGERYVLLDFYGISACEAFDTTIQDEGRLREMPRFSKLVLDKAAQYGR